MYITCRGRSHWKSPWKWPCATTATLVRMQFILKDRDRGMLLLIMH